ncbi:MAG: carboxypeptidase-like regulatory domain-containing protein [Verrucomicrobia bacterium]|nr:carboxypeptidase-like regulatory domain-containing protein [Verrucomicrobiota bacterium]
MIAAPHAAVAADSAETMRYGASVTDIGGHAIVGAVVRAYQYPTQGRSVDPELVTNVTTGANGKFEVTLRPYSPLVVTKPGLAPAWRDPSPNDTNGAPMVLSPPTMLTGIVVDETGQPLSGAEVFVCVAHQGDKKDYRTFLHRKLTRQLFSSHTDASGHFRIENFPANSTAELDVRAPGKVLPPRRADYGPDSLLWRSGQQDIRLAVEPPAEIEGRVETDTGEPVTNAWVELRSVARTLAVPWEPYRNVTNGLFRFAGVAGGAYQVFAQFGTNQPPDWVAEAVPVAVRSGQSVQGVEVKAAKGGVLRVKSIDKKTGKPVEQVYLTVYVGSDYLHLRSDSNGLALFRLMPGRYDVHGMTDKGLHAYTPAQIEAGATNDASLEFSSPPLVGGIVRDASGKPAPGLSVWPPPEQLKTNLTTDVNGRFALVHRENPQVVLAVDALHNLAVSQELEEGVTNLDLQLKPALTITGRVEDPQGGPISNARALVYLNSGSWGFPVYWQPVTTDAQGHFKIVNLPTDRTYYINFGAKGFGSAQEKVPTEEGNAVEMPPVVLRKADLKLLGKVVDSAGAPLANASIRAEGNGQPEIEVQADANGRFALEVCQGTVSMHVRFQELQTSVQAQAGDTDVVATLAPKSGHSEPEKPKRASLIGKALPDLSSVNLPGDAAAPGKAILLCLFDCEQRPSRQAIRLLTEQTEPLRQKGVAVLGIQAAVVSSDSFDPWKEANPLPFKIGRTTAKSAASAWATDTESLPWLILVNSQGRVAAEGFPLEDLPRKIASLEK